MPTRAELEILIKARDESKVALAQARANLANVIAETKDKAPRLEAKAAVEEARRAVLANSAATLRMRQDLINAGVPLKDIKTDVKGLTKEFSAMYSTMAGGGAFGLGTFRIGTTIAQLGITGLIGGAVGMGLAFLSAEDSAMLAFRSILKGAGQSEALMRSLKDTIRDIPYSFTDVTVGAQQLLQAGFTDIPGMLKTISNALMGAGVISSAALSGITEQLAQMKATGVFSLGAINTIAAQGIPIIQMLAKQFGTTEYGISRLLERLSGHVPMDFMMPHIMKVLEDFGALADKTDTLSESIAILRNNFSNLMAHLTGGVFTTAKGGLEGLNGLLSMVNEYLEKVPSGIKSIAGWGLVLGATLSGMHSMFGHIPGLGAITGVLGGAVGRGQGTGGAILGVALLLIALIAVLTPWEDIFKNIKAGIDKTIEEIRALPPAIAREGGGGRGTPPTGAVPATELPLIPRLLFPVQILIPTVMLHLAPVLLSNIERFTASLDLIPNIYQVVDIVRQWHPITHMIDLLPSPGWVQSWVSMWAPMVHSIDLVPQMGWVQGWVNTWSYITHNISLIPSYNWVQFMVDAWPWLSHILQLIPHMAPVINMIALWPMFEHGLKLIPHIDLSSVIETLSKAVEFVDWRSVAAGLGAIALAALMVIALKNPAAGQAVLKAGAGAAAGAVVIPRLPYGEFPDTGQIPYGASPATTTGPGGEMIQGYIQNGVFYPYGSGYYGTSGGTGNYPMSRMAEPLPSMHETARISETYNISLHGNIYPNDVEDLVVRAIDEARRRGRDT